MSASSFTEKRVPFVCTAWQPRQAGSLLRPSFPATEVGASSGRLLQRLLVPRHGHGRSFTMAVAAPVFRTVLEPVDATRELFDGFFVGQFALFGAGQFRVAQNARLTVAAGPGNQRRRTRGKKVHPIERTVFIVKADHTALYLVFAHVPAIQV